MKPDTNEIILPESDKAAKLVTLQLWKSRRGKLFQLKNEEAARMDGATHRYCEDCGQPTPKYPYTVCPKCKDKRDRERWLAKPHEAWNGETPICIMGSDEYFFSEDDLNDYCDEHECEPEDLLLVHCKRRQPHRFRVSDWFGECIPEDSDASCLPKPILDAVDALNKAIEDNPLDVWIEGDEALL